MLQKESVGSPVLQKESVGSPVLHSLPGQVALGSKHTGGEEVFTLQQSIGCEQASGAGRFGVCWTRGKTPVVRRQSLGQLSLVRPAIGASSAARHGNVSRGVPGQSPADTVHGD